MVFLVFVEFGGVIDFVDFSVDLDALKPLFLVILQLAPKFALPTANDGCDKI